VSGTLIAMAARTSTPARWIGLCLVAAGALISGAVAHPDAFHTGFATAAGQPGWAAWHTAWLVSAVLSLFGLAGLYAYHAGRLGVLGLAGLVLAVPGLVLVACAAYVEALLMPVLARIEPTLLDWHGPPLTIPAIRVVGVLALTWFLGVGADRRRHLAGERPPPPSLGHLDPRGGNLRRLRKAAPPGARGRLGPGVRVRPHLARAHHVVVEHPRPRIDNRGEHQGLEEA